MTTKSKGRPEGPSRGTALLFALGGVLAFSACGGGAPPLPEPRPIINHQGARLRLDVERATEINEWVTREQTNIQEDPSFWVIDDLTTEAVYPWEGLRISTDSVWVQVDARAIDARLVHQIYGHLHLMVHMGRQEEWLPEAPNATGYELERAILERAADAWLLGRTTFDTAPYAPLDELVYANEAGYLDAFIFTARPNEFAADRAAWARRNPGQADEYREWFLSSFNREPPGLRAG